MPVDPSPTEVEVCIEIPRGSCIKRGSTGVVDFVSPLPCPFNYGSVPAYLGLEGDLLDAVVLGPRLPRGAQVKVRAWAAIGMTDRGLYDDLYLRSTGDGRLLVGGADDDRDVPAHRDRMVNRKAANLEHRVARLLLHLVAGPALAWAGTFAGTRDGLPLFGRHPQYGPRILFALAYGGNGITYSMLGAGLLRAQIERRTHPLSRLFSFNRLS